MDWKRRVLRMGTHFSKQWDSGARNPRQALDQADVLWIVWGTDGPAPGFRVVRGRNLAGPGLRHGVIVVGDEITGLAFVEGRGDRIAVMNDGETLGIPEPPVPQAHIDMVMSDHVPLCDGRVMTFRPVGTA